MELKRALSSGLLVIYLACTPAAYAEVPIVDATEAVAEPKAAASEANATAADTTANLPTDQRITIVERQIANLTQMNLLAQINSLQQQLQDLRGQIEVQNHTIQVLQDQLRTQYQDLDQ